MTPLRSCWSRNQSDYLGKQEIKIGNGGLMLTLSLSLLLDRVLDMSAVRGASARSTSSTATMKITNETGN